MCKSWVFGSRGATRVTYSFDGVHRICLKHICVTVGCARRRIVKLVRAQGEITDSRGKYNHSSQRVTPEQCSEIRQWLAGFSQGFSWTTTELYHSWINSKLPHTMNKVLNRPLSKKWFEAFCAGVEEHGDLDEGSNKENSHVAGTEMDLEEEDEEVALEEQAQGEDAMEVDVESPSDISGEVASAALPKSDPVPIPRPASQQAVRRTNRQVKRRRFASDSEDDASSAEERPAPKRLRTASSFTLEGYDTSDNEHTLSLSTSSSNRSHDFGSPIPPRRRLLPTSLLKGSPRKTLSAPLSASTSWESADWSALDELAQAALDFVA